MKTSLMPCTLFLLSLVDVGFAYPRVSDLVEEIFRIAKLPELYNEQLKAIKEDYERSSSSPAPTPAPAVGEENVEAPAKDGFALGDLELSPELFKVLKLLPEDYDIRKIPKEVIQAVAKGELPDLNLLPVDLQQHFMANFRKFVAEFSKEEVGFDDVISKLPKFERTEVTTFTPYDKKYVSKRDMKKEGSDMSWFRDYAVAAIVLVSIVSIVILTTFCFFVKRDRKSADENSLADRKLLKTSEANSFAESTPRRSGRPKPPHICISPHAAVLY